MDLKSLCMLPGVSGREEAVRRAVFDACTEKLGKENVRFDKMGNIIAHKAGKGARKVLLAAHLDEVGLLTVSAGEDGMLRVRASGRADSRFLVSKHVKVCLPGAEPVPGVIGATAIHLQSDEELERALSIEDLYVDIGAKDKDEALSKAPLGTPVVFDSQPVELAGGRLAAKALPSRAGVWNLLRLMDGDYAADVDFVFTSLAEVAGRGIHGAANRLDPDCALILDAAPANDGGDTPETEKRLRLGGGAAVSFMDRTGIASPALFAEVMAAAEKNGVPVQVQEGVGTSQEAGGMQLEKSGVRTVVVSVPARNLYSPLCVCSLSDIDAQERLIRAFLG